MFPKLRSFIKKYINFLIFVGLDIFAVNPVNIDNTKWQEIVVNTYVDQMLRMIS